MKPGTKPKGKIRLEWTRNLAYAIGLLVADGCLSKDRRHIDFTSVDLDQIETFKRCLGIHTKTSIKFSGAGNPSYHTQFGDVLFYQFLLDIGLTPAKSKTLGAIQIPTAYFMDFMRGYFDGDGSTTSYQDPHFPNSFRFIMSFTSGSEQYLQWLQSELTTLLGVTGYVCHDSSCSYVQLKYGKRDAAIVARAMYREADAPRLQRKQLKIMESLGIIA